MFSINLGSRQRDGCLVAVLRGELDIAAATGLVGTLGAAGRQVRIIVDLADLEFIDCCGVTALVNARRHAQDAGGDLLLAAPRRAVLRMLAIVGRRTAFRCTASVAEASAVATPSGSSPQTARAGACHRAALPGRVALAADDRPPPLMLACRSASTTSSAADWGTSTRENLSAISIAPMSRPES